MDFTLILASIFRTSPENAVLIIGVIVAVANLVGRLIPDNATGALGVIRKIAKVIGLYTSNRVQSKVSVNDVTNAALRIPNVSKDARARSPWIVSVIVGIIALLVLSGCATALTATETVCQRQAAIRAAAQATLEALEYCPVLDGPREEPAPESEGR